MKTTGFLVCAAAALAACSDQSTTGPTDIVAARAVPPAGARGLTVMTRNVYPGVKIEAIMQVPVEQIPIATAEAWGKLQYTNFPERAGALAAEIADNRPHLVGLQEVPIYRTQLPGDAAFGGQVPATAVAFDFVQLLLDSLEARGAHYVVAVDQRTIDVEVPAFAGFGGDGYPFFMDVRYTDGDAILVRADVPHANPASGTYQYYIPFELGGVPIRILRGWGAVDATVGGISFRFVNTHLEDMVPQIQVAQAMELLGILAAETKPIVMTGDFNSDALTNDTPTYGMLLGAGFADVWAQAYPTVTGATCCHVELLNNPTPELTKRLDLVLLRGGSVTGGVFEGGLQAAIVGDELNDRTSSGLWPSDHAGVVAVIRTPGFVKDF